MKTVNRKVSRRTFLGMAALGTASLAACVAPPPASKPAANSSVATSAPVEAAKPATGLLEMEYWHRQGGDTAKILETFAGEFSKENDGKFKMTAIAQGEISELNKKVRAAAAGGGLPAVIMADDYDVTQYAAAKILAPLDDYISTLKQEQIDDILPNQLTRHKLDLYGGKTMAFTQGFSAFTTFWNVDALKKAGIEKPPARWDDFPKHVREVVKANDGMTGWQIGGLGDRFISTLLTYGVDWIKPSGDESNFDAPETLEIMTWFRQLSDEGLLSVPSKGARDNFMAAKNVYWMDSSGSTATFSKQVTNFQWSAGMPLQRTKEGSKPVTETYGPINALPNTTPEKQQAGWQWMTWLLRPENHSRHTAVSNYFPATKSAVASVNLKAYYEANPTARRLVEEVAPNARILVPNAALAEVRGQVTANVVNEVLLKKLSAEEGAKKLKAEADKAIQNAKRS